MKPLLRSAGRSQRRIAARAARRAPNSLRGSGLSTPPPEGSTRARKDEGSSGEMRITSLTANRRGDGVLGDRQYTDLNECNRRTDYSKSTHLRPRLVPVVGSRNLSPGGSHPHPSAAGSHWCQAGLRARRQHLDRDRRIGPGGPLPVEHRARYRLGRSGSGDPGTFSQALPLAWQLHKKRSHKQKPFTRYALRPRKMIRVANP